MQFRIADSARRIRPWHCPPPRASVVPGLVTGLPFGAVKPQLRAKPVANSAESQGHSCVINRDASTNTRPPRLVRGLPFGAVKLGPADLRGPWRVKIVTLSFIVTYTCPVCLKLYQPVPPCTGLYRPVRNCTELYRIVPIWTAPP
jgi:hypothetical protein